MGNKQTTTTKYSLPKDLGIDPQIFLKRVECDLKVFGCVIVQDHCKDYKYIIENNVFTVKDMTGNGTLIAKQVLKDRHKCTLVSTIEEDIEEEDDADEELSNDLEQCTISSNEATVVTTNN